MVWAVRLATLAVLMSSCTDGQSACALPDAAAFTPDASVGHCTVGNALTECTDSNGWKSIGVGGTPPGNWIECHDDCAPTEFAIACGCFGSNCSDEPPPSLGCRTLPAAPEVAFYCCPCSR